MSCQIVPKLRNEKKLLRRGQAIHFQKRFENHGWKISSDVFGSRCGSGNKCAPAKAGPLGIADFFDCRVDHPFQFRDGTGNVVPNDYSLLRTTVLR